MHFTCFTNGGFSREEMSPIKDWNEEEDNFDLTLSQRTEELYRIPNREPYEEGMIEACRRHFPEKEFSIYGQGHSTGGPFVCMLSQRIPNMAGVCATEHSPFGYICRERDIWGGDMGKITGYERVEKKGKGRSDPFNELYIRTWRDLARYLGLTLVEGSDLTVRDRVLYNLIVFALLSAILWKFAWNPILGALDARERAIQKTIEDAERLQAEAQALLEEHGKRLAEAREERNKILEEARQAGDHLKADVLEKARHEADQVLARAHRQIELETEQALLTIRDQAADLALRAAERVIERALTEEDHRRLAREAVSELTESLG